VLSGFIRDVAFKGPPFPRAVDLVERFRRVTPPDLKYLITDLFDTITFYDNRTESVTYRKVAGKFHVVIKGQTRKTRSDGLGHETEVPMNDSIDIGVYDKAGKLIALEKRFSHSGENIFELEVNEEPAKGGIDPVNKLIDKVPDDNVVKATQTL
jgi:hypothetical protein